MRGCNMSAMTTDPRLELELILNNALPDETFERTEGLEELLTVKGTVKDYDEKVKKLRTENFLLRKENVELRKQLQALKMRNTGIASESEYLRAPSGLKTNHEGESLRRKGDMLSEVSREPQCPDNCSGAECGLRGEVEKRNGELRLGKQGLGGSCALAGPEKVSCCKPFVASGHALSAYAIRRYSRQLLVPSFGVAGQERLLKSSAVVVGCGGLGSPIALYLAAAGIGCLGLVDHDIVELSNLHRQVIHLEASVGEAKVKSAASACLGLNSSLQVLQYGDGLTAANAVDIVSKFDVVLDATDNLPTRYLLNDACVVTRKPLVSGAALGTDGQLTVYNHNNGPCYRCLFPIPSPQRARQRCSDNGVIGVVPGIIGTLQALEALKLATGVGETLSSRMLILDALSTRIHMVKLRGRNSTCIACGDAPQILLSNLHQYDYEEFTQSPLSDEAPEGQHIISENDRISGEELKRHLDSDQAHVLLDVRDAHEYAITSLPNSINIPFSSLKTTLHILAAAVADTKASSGGSLEGSESTSDQLVFNDEESYGKITASSLVSPPIYVVCRRGNDSQRAVQFLREEGFSTAVDVVGGLEAWVKYVDRDFPFY